MDIKPRRPNQPQHHPAQTSQAVPANTPAAKPAKLKRAGHKLKHGSKRHAHTLVKVASAKSHQARNRFILMTRPQQALIIFAFAFTVLSLGLFYNHYQAVHSYDLSKAEASLLGKPSVNISKIQQTQDAVAFNQQKANTQDGTNSQVTVASKTDSTGQFPYKASLAKTASSGITFGDASSDTSFKLIPQFDMSQGKYDAGQVIYPSTHGTKQVYTFKRNGLKADILLNKAPGNQLSYSWKLELPDSLSAKMLPNGAVGIYSANPLLSDPNLQVGDTKSQELIDKAKNSSTKDYLAFVIPAPYITEAKDSSTNKDKATATATEQGKPNYNDVKYELKDNILTLKASNLKDKSYPLTIDPTVTVTTTADFQTAYYDDGMINYGTSNQIGRSNVSIGSVSGTWTATTSFGTARVNHASVAYNGYLYVVGGYDGTNYKNDVQYALICTGSNNGVGGCGATAGTVGTWNTTNTFTTGRSSFGLVTFNGYMYVMGGNDTATTYKNDVQYALICTGSNNGVSGCNSTAGTVGTWATTTSFISARFNFTAAVNKGYIYVLGGCASISSGCNDLRSDVQYASINADGTVSAWHYTHNSTDDNTTYVSGFNTARQGHSTVIYNNYIYVIGGGDPDNLLAYDDVQHAPINSDGTVGTWVTDSAAFSSPPRLDHSSYAYNGYLYITAGNHIINNTGCNASATVYCSDIQYAPINADGSIGTWTATTSISSGTARAGHTTVAYNGFLYVIGGVHAAANFNCNGTSSVYCSDVLYNSINTGTLTSFGKSTTWAYTHNSTNDGGTYQSGFTRVRSGHSSVVYNGFLYVIGGITDTNNDDCTLSSGLSHVCNGTQYAPINSNGTIGTWNYTYNGNSCSTWTNPCNTGFTAARWLHSSVAYNGYLYVIGGERGSSGSDDCVTASSGYCNGVQFAPINANGTIGTWAYTHNSTNDGTTFQAGFVRARVTSSAVYKSKLYIIAGLSQTGDDCSGGGGCGGTEFASINSDGTIGTWNYTYNGNSCSTWTSPCNTGITNGRYSHASAIYNGYIYVYGGANNTNTDDCTATANRCNGVLYTPINSDGTIGTWNYTYNGNSCSTWTAPCNTGFNVARSDIPGLAYNGYLYVVGGYTSAGGSDCSSSFCNGTQYAPINSNGTIGTWNYTYNGNSCSTWTNPCNTGFTIARGQHSTVAYNGFIYVSGGQAAGATGDCSSPGGLGSYFCNGTQFTSISTPANSAHYERLIDSGNQSSVYQISYNGTAPCGLDISYRTAPSSGVFSTSVTYIPNAQPGVTYSPTTPDVRYMLLDITFNDQSCGVNTIITDFTIVFNNPPTTPTLTSPASSSTNQSLTPIFRLSSTDIDSSDYLRYEIQICTTSNCSSVLTTVCQDSNLPNSCSGSQTGWSSQSLPTSGGIGTAYTAYSSGQSAVYTYQGTLSANTQYWWRAYAIDPAGSNTSSSASSIGTFTTVNPASNNQHDRVFQGTICFGSC